MDIGGSPFEWLPFDKQGALQNPDSRQRVEAMAKRPGITDLVVISHGWNNDLSDALRLYQSLWTHSAGELSAKGRDPARFAVVGLLWPAKAYDAQYDGAEEFVAALGQGGAQSLGSGGDDTDMDAPLDHLERALAQAREFIDDPEAFEPVRHEAILAAETGDEAAPFRFFETAKPVFGLDPADQDVELRQDTDLFARTGTIMGANDLLAALSAPQVVPMAPGVGAAQGIGDAVRAVFSGPRSGVIWALNKLTYYTMKKRAGVVGKGLAETLAAIAPDHRVRLHFVGHSFGARLVTAAAAELRPIANFEFRSLTLLQGAYSHNGMTRDKGPFAGVIGKPTGAISFTHTHNDKACTIAYPIASRLSGDTAMGLGDAADPFGAMGANGPQLTGSMMAADRSDTAFAPVPGKINRFRADAYVVKTAQSDAHNNVGNLQCGRLVAATIAA